MASEIIVNTIKAPTTGANANKVIIPSGVTLDANAGDFRPPAGSVIQTAYATRGRVQISGTAANVLGFLLECPITPKYSSSKLLILTNMGNVSNGGSGRMEMQVRIASTSGASDTGNFVNRQQAAADGAGTSHVVNMSDASLFSPNTTSTRYVKIYMEKHDSTSNTYYVGQYGGGDTNITVMEIAQ